jgi:hypothetical protein
MDVSLDDMLRLWGLYRFPALLADDELFDELLSFIHALLTEAVRAERAAVMTRLMIPSTS